jgi:hypothetical protein
MAFTEHEKSRIRHHLGYPIVASITTFALGVPMAIEPSFMLESAMDKIIPGCEDVTREKIAVLDKIEQQMVEDLELLSVRKVDEIEINENELSALRKQYDYWASSLANDFRVLRNPYDFRLQTGGINVSVQH